MDLYFATVARDASTALSCPSAATSGTRSCSACRTAGTAASGRPAGAGAPRRAQTARLPVDIDFLFWHEF